MKTCRQCEKELPLESFKKRKASSDGRLNTCKKCVYARQLEYWSKNPDSLSKVKAARSRRYAESLSDEARARNRDWYRKNAAKHCEKSKWSAIKRQYGLTREQYDEILRSQGGKCPICLNCMETRGVKAPCVDHCHSTGRVRGLLCRNCNASLGGMGDSLEALERAVEYMKKSLTGPLVSASMGPPS